MKNRGRPWPREREGPTKWEGFSFSYHIPSDTMESMIIWIL